MPAVLRPALSSVTRRTLKSALARDRSISFCRLRTLGRSSSRDAVKMRCRRRRTSSSTDAQSIEHQSRSSPSGPFTTAAPWRPTCPSVPVSSVIVASTGLPDLRQHPFGSGMRPYPASYARRPAEGPATRPGFLSPFRLPAFASQVVLSPPGDWAFLAVGLPGNARTPSGFHVSHAQAATGLGAL